MGRDEPQTGSQSPDDGENSTGGTLARGVGWSSLGWHLMLTFVAFALAGRWIDGKFDTDPWGLLGGCFLGFVALIVMAQRSASRD